ncbi:MAG: hypothetical protein HWQ35_23460 [Nostoc sp. NMS1]|uniref:hypothetical protein n=1 Tax=unclassified Nostoc TaxID=2593658 RepID=UPI0025E0A95F|nr:MULTISPECIES: hypothetical protein [unclassified Nostoc]MBN3909397.1 hypothetical protein [Nostoc sp. NMS1]MBN3992577.1 hypothetical protein [Nostoc sp. NMS2]
MQEFLFALTLSALPVVSNFMGAMIAEALPSSKQTLGLALHAAAGVLLAIVEEILPEAHQTQDTNLSTLTFIGSFALSMLFSSYLE